MTTHQASCTCGRLTAAAHGEPIRVSICHCLACQRRTGSVFGAQARFARENVEVAGLAAQYVRVGDAGGRATFNFCPTCGATVYFTVEGFEASIAIPVGAFAEPGFAAPSFSMYEERKHAWVGLPDDIEHLA